VDAVPADSKAPRETSPAVAGLTRTDWFALLLYVSVAIAVGFADYRVRPGMQQDYGLAKYIPGVIDGSIGAPATYRVLAPYTIDFFVRLTGLEPLVAFVVSRLLFIYAALATTHLYLRQWYSSAASVGGTLGVAALLPLTFTDGWAHPDSFPELFLFTLGCALVARKRDLAFLVVLVLAMLNRETSAFLALLWAAFRLSENRSPATLSRAIVFGLSCVAVYVGMRWLRGMQHYDYVMLGENWANLKPAGPGYDPYRRLFGLFWLILLAVPAWLAAVTATVRTGTPLFIRHAVPVAAAYLVTCWTISRLIEARILLPMFPLLLPAVMAAFTRPASGVADAAPAPNRG
jgi:hypothetical protein